MMTIRDTMTGRLRSMAPEISAEVQHAADRIAELAKMNVRSMFRRGTGRLEASISVVDREGMSARVVADAPHAQYLEYGTRYIHPPRQFMAPAVRDGLRGLEDGLRAAVRRRFG